MDLLLLRPDDAAPADLAELAERRRADTVVQPDTWPAAPRRPALAVYALVDAFAAALQSEERLACHTASGDVATLAGRTIACANHPREAGAVGARVSQAARLSVDGVLLEAPEAWAAAGLGGAGFCPSCRDALNAALVREYPEQYVAYDPLPALAQEDGRAQSPFWREHRRVRFEAALAHARSIVLHARDEARQVRSSELAVGALLQDLSPTAVQLAAHLDLAVLPVALPTPERLGLAGLEILAAPLGRRPAFARLTTLPTPAEVAHAAALASAVGAGLVLPAAASEAAHAALAEHRAFWTEFRSRYRPTQRLAEAVVLYAPSCDLWTEGAHRTAVEETLEALTRLGVQYRVATEMPRDGTAPVVLAEAAALPEDDAARLERRVAEGAGCIVIGRCAAVDGTGRALEGPFTELREGLNRAGAGTVFAIAPEGPRPSGEVLARGLDDGLGSLLGKGRRAVATAGGLVVKLFLDPDRKLDVHVVARTADAGPVRGAQLHLGGPAVSGARTGYFFSRTGAERKVSLVPFGMGVSATLPEFEGGGVLTVPR